MLIGVSGSYCYLVTLRLRCLGVLRAWENLSILRFTVHGFEYEIFAC